MAVEDRSNEGQLTGLIPVSAAPNARWDKCWGVRALLVAAASLLQCVEAQGSA